MSSTCRSGPLLTRGTLCAAELPRAETERKQIELPMVTSDIIAVLSHSLYADDAAGDRSEGHADEFRLKSVDTSRAIFSRSRSTISTKFASRSSSVSIQRWSSYPAFFVAVGCHSEFQTELWEHRILLLTRRRQGRCG